MVKSLINVAPIVFFFSLLRQIKNFFVANELINNILMVGWYPVSQKFRLNLSQLIASLGRDVSGVAESDKGNNCGLSDEQRSIPHILLILTKKRKKPKTKFGK